GIVRGRTARPAAWPFLRCSCRAPGKRLRTGVTPGHDGPASLENSIEPALYDQMSLRGHAVTALDEVEFRVFDAQAQALQVFLRDCGGVKFIVPPRHMETCCCHWLVRAGLPIAR